MTDTDSDTDDSETRSKYGIRGGIETVEQLRGEADTSAEDDE